VAALPAGEAWNCSFPEAPDRHGTAQQAALGSTKRALTMQTSSRNRLQLVKLRKAKPSEAKGSWLRLLFQAEASRAAGASEALP